MLIFSFWHDSSRGGCREGTRCKYSMCARTKIKVSHNCINTCLWQILHVSALSQQWVMYFTVTLVSVLLLRWYRFYCYVDIIFTATLVSVLLLRWYRFTVTFVSFLLLHSYRFYCYVGIVFTVTLVSFLLLRWYRFYCYVGIVLTVTLVSHLMLRWYRFENRVSINQICRTLYLF